MKNKNATLSFNNVINIRLAVKLNINERRKMRRSAISTFGIGSSIVKMYSNDVRDNISAYRAAQNIPITY
jgi:hypothetical protein